MYYPEAVYNLYKKHQVEKESKIKENPIEAPPESWDEVVKKYLDRRFTS